METIPIFDGHNDTLLKLRLPERGGERGFFERGDLGHIDLPRAREGGFGGGFFACYVPNPEDEWIEESALTLTEGGYEVADAPPVDPVYARRFADELVEILFRTEAESDAGLSSHISKSTMPPSRTSSTSPRREPRRCSSLRCSASRYSAPPATRPLATCCGRDRRRRV